MDKKILITGPPRCGKSTLISKLIEYYTIKKNYKIYGFLTPEVRESGNRIGFDIVDIFSNYVSQLARVGDFKTKYRVGKYNVFIKIFNEYLENVLDLDDEHIDLIIIDEIGKMELLSMKFQNFIKKIFSSNITVLATIGLKLNHPLKDYLLNLPFIKTLNLSKQNFQSIYEKVISIIP
ncbi:MAG: nucleoside-triphosphatase [Candidatus Odinarchaeota archaeon]